MPSQSHPYDQSPDIEKNGSSSTNNDEVHQLDHSRTPGGHVNDTSQPALPVVHRKFANPAPLGLLSFATSIFLISITGVHARGIQTPNILVGVMMFFGGVSLYLSAIMEFVAGNTFGATVFASYGGFNLSYAMLYIPGTGIIASYMNPTTNELQPEFYQALAMFVWAWFILTVIYTVAAMRSSWVLFICLFTLDIELILLAAGYMTGSSACLVAGNSLGFIVAFCAYWAGIAGLFAGGLTPFEVPTFAMYKQE